MDPSFVNKTLAQARSVHGALLARLTGDTTAARSELEAALAAQMRMYPHTGGGGHPELAKTRRWLSELQGA